MNRHALIINPKRYALFEPGGRMVRDFRDGKLTEARYIDVAPLGIESRDLEEFLNLLRAATDQFSLEKLSDCRVGYVDDNGVGKYYDPLEFLENQGEMDKVTARVAS